MKVTANQQAVIDIVARNPQGAGVDTIGAALPDISRRTLQRLLGELIEAGRLTRRGKGRATTYALAVVETPPALEDYTTFIPLADTSRDLIMRLRKPLAARVPVA